jgi:hypothetical protein
VKPLQVAYEAYLYATRIPRRYIVHLYVNEIPTGIMATVWGRRRARELMSHMVNHGNALVNEYGVAAEIAAEVHAQQREKAMAKVQVGDSVRLLIDIGPFKKGRVCRVVEVAEPSFYTARGTKGWDDDLYPVKVLPVRAAGDAITLGPSDAISLARGEFGPVNDEVDDD